MPVKHTSPPSLATLPELVANGGKIASSFVAGLSWVALSELLPTAISDTNLALASGTSQGTDRTAAIASAVSARFPSGNVAINWDLAITGTISIPGSNVTIQALRDNCGMKRPQSSQEPVIRNASPVLGTRSGTPILPVTGAGGPDAAVTLGGWTQSNIRIRGGTWHGGANNTSNFAIGTGGPVTIMRFWGVDGLEISGANVFDSPTFHIFPANTRNMLVTRNVVRVPSSTPGGTGTGRDCIHLDGPHDLFEISRNTLCADDDAITFEANDGNTLTFPYPWALPGDQTRGKILHNFLDNSSSGIRGLSSARLVDQIEIVGNHGTTRNQSFVMDTLRFIGAPDIGGATDIGPSTGANQEPGNGNFGTILLADHDVMVTDDALGIGPIWIQGDFDKLIMRNLTFRPVSAVTSPFLTIYQGSNYNVLEYDVNVTDSAGLPRVICQDNGTGAIVRGRVTIARPGQSGAAMPCYRKSLGATKAFFGSVYAENVNNIVDLAAGTLESVVLDGIHKGASGGSGSVAVASGLTITNLAAHGLATALIKSGAGTVTHQYPASETYAFA